MDERRKFVRLDTRLGVTYTVLQTGAVGQTVSKDIGGGGVCVFTEHVLPPGTRLQVAMQVPGVEGPVHFIAEVMWSEQYEIIGRTEHRRAVETGVRFVEIAPQDQQVVMQHVILNLQQRFVPGPPPTP